jgi:iron(II)-dependent oxidoreductase
VSAPETLRELAQVHTLLNALVEDCDDAGIRAQFHPDLSPLGWHLGHCVYTETYWLQEVGRGDASRTAKLADLYVPENIPRPERGPRLPPRDQLLAWAGALQSDNLMLLANLTAADKAHPPHQNDYLARFLIQHHSQHYETMLMILTQRALAADYPAYRVGATLQPDTRRDDPVPVPAAHYRIGGAAPDAFDNELPRQVAELGGYAIASRPVSNGQYLAFMQAGGYRLDAYWSEDGRVWRDANQACAPEHWRRDEAGDWYGIGIQGPYDLAPDAPVHGISHYEACAYADWAGGRLPHEYQWEVARRLQLLEDAGRVWEWCANPFHPYAGFKAFPYDGYSIPWFDGKHYSLRGGSLHTRPLLRRPSFRNFYTPDKRHVFAGLRLVY